MEKNKPAKGVKKAVKAKSTKAKTVSAGKKGTAVKAVSRSRRMELGELTPQQEAFCREYIIDLNGTKAAIRAGYSEATAANQASRLLGKDEIKRFIQKLLDKRAKRTALTADEVIGDIRELRDMCMGRVPIKTTNAGGEVVEKRRFDALGASKALEMLGKNLKLFTDKVEHSGRVEQVVVNIDRTHSTTTTAPAWEAPKKA